MYVRAIEGGSNQMMKSLLSSSKLNFILGIMESHGAFFLPMYQELLGFVRVCACVYFHYGI